MLRSITVLAAFLAVANGRSLQPALRLRGGVDAGQVANGALALSAINGGMMALSPSKAGEIYEVEMSEADSLIVKYMGGMMLSNAIAIYYAIGGTDVITALGYGQIPNMIQQIQGALNDDQAKFGQEGPIKYLNLVISAVVTYTLLQGGPLDQTLTAKVYAGWSALNGIGMYFASGKMVEAWGADAKTVNPIFLKTMGTFITVVAATFWLLATGEDAIKTLGMTTALMLATMIDGNFITGDAPGSKNMQYFWMAVNAAVCYFTLA
eukprot:scaffold80518_cov57-Phaeocystis_antarctica.AAC.2